MFIKVFGIALLFALTRAAPVEQSYQATSYSSFNEHHNSVQHIQSSPTLIKAAVAVPVHGAPAVHVAPVAVKSYAALPSAQSYSSVSHAHSAPVAQFAAPFAIAHSAPVNTAPGFVKSVPVVVKAAGHEEESYGPAKYEFAYGVEDHHTGDIHSQKESRDGDFTKGEYSLHEADGTIRTVKYTVDKHGGFNAIVERSSHAGHPQPGPVAKALVAAPTYHY